MKHLDIAILGAGAAGLDRLFQKIDSSGPDLSFADFLARRPGGKSLARAREEAHQLVLGPAGAALAIDAKRAPS